MKKASDGTPLLDSCLMGRPSSSFSVAAAIPNAK